MRTVAVVGTRHWVGIGIVEHLLRELLPSDTTEIVSGGQLGVDSDAEDYARDNGIPFRKFPMSEETGTFTERAHKRNQKIADAANVIIAFPCSHSRGTYDTVSRFTKTHDAAPIIRQLRCSSFLR